jgi:hypothetical protein
MKKLIKDETGNVIAFTAITMIVLIGFMALGIDVGTMMVARNQLQAAADAAALAGASGLTISQGAATSRAIQFGADNTCMNQSVQVSPTDVTFPTTSRIQVQTHQIINLNFASVIGIPTANISAVAAAEIGTIIGTNGLRPWALPDLNWPLGSPVTLKAGEAGAPNTNPGFFYPVDFPPVNRGNPVEGAQAYEQNIADGSIYDVFIGDSLKIEPGNMVGPTQQGITDLIAQDPYLDWDSGQNYVYDTQTGQIVDSSPRIIKIPLYDASYTPPSGRNGVRVIGLAAFFVTGIQGRDVTGVFMEYTTTGTPGNGNSSLKGVKLVL